LPATVVGHHVGGYGAEEDAERAAGGAQKQ